MKSIKKRLNCCSVILNINETQLDYYPIDQYETLVQNLIVNYNNNSKQQNDINNVLKYYYVWNGMFTMLDDFDQDWDTVSELKKKLNQYIIRHIAYTAVFGTVIPDNKQSKKNIIAKVKEHITTDELSKLINYCTKDISESYNGTKYIIIHRLSFAILNNLFVIPKNDSNLSNDDTLHFPQLRLLFEILYNFSLYYACCAQHPTKNESFYISQYWSLKDQQFIGDNNDNDGLNYQMTNFNYFDNLGGGTILHFATSRQMTYYVSVLLKDGFDCQLKNRDDSEMQSSYDIAIEENMTSIVQKFNQIIHNVCTLHCFLFCFVCTSKK